MRLHCLCRCRCLAPSLLRAETVAESPWFGDRASRSSSSVASPRMSGQRGQGDWSVFFGGKRSGNWGR
eukprot:5852471-Lingulodinium_polyedra.AAC.1